MSTEYSIIRQDNGTEFSVTERSNKFSLDINENVGTDDFASTTIEGLTTDQLALVVIEVAQVLSYFDEDLVKAIGEVLISGHYPYDEKIIKLIKARQDNSDGCKWAIGVLASDSQKIGGFCYGPYSSYDEMVKEHEAPHHCADNDLPTVVCAAGRMVACKLYLDKDPVIIGYY